MRVFYWMFTAVVSTLGWAGVSTLDLLTHDRHAGRTVTSPASLPDAAAPVFQGGQTLEFSFTPSCDRTRDSLALVALYNATNGPIWTNKWNLNAPMGSWYGVQFNNQGCVRAIRLPNNQLQGNLPQELGNLEQLEELWLQINFLIGPIPDTITNCSLLRDLRMFNNQLSGNLPDISKFDSLRFVNIARNVIRGSLPTDIGRLRKLNYLNLGDNRLTDTIPAGLTQLTELTLLDLSENRLEGRIPENIGNLFKLRELYLFRNQLSGAIPGSISQIADLEMLWLYNNQLSGAVPDVSNLPLVSFRLEFNRLEDLPDLSGLDDLGIAFPDGLTAQFNRLTFEDIIPNLPLELALFEYVPQDSITEVDTVYLFEGDNFVWDLGIDEDIPDNNYKFFRNDTVIRFQNERELVVPDLMKRNAGVYMAEVTNFTVPDLVLWTRPLVLIVQDTSNCGKPAASSACVTAPRLCDVTELDDYCGTLPDTISLSTPRPLCTMGIPENAHWISFVASQEEMAIRVIPSSCVGQLSNGQRIAGMQGAILSSCDFNNTDYLDCSGTCSEDPFTLASDSFVPGATYWLVLDGCVADICDYRLELVLGNRPFELPEPDTILGEDPICYGEAQRYFLTDTSIFTQEYMWTSSTGDTITTLSSRLDYTWLASGNVSLCVAAISDCDTTDVYCRDILVAEPLRVDTSSRFCVMDKSGYQVIIDLEGGVPPYSLVEGPGTINQGSVRFLSDTLENDSSYLLVFEDSLGCRFDTTVYFNCICESDAGEMDMNLQELCIGDTAVAMHLGGQFLDAEDDSVFIVHTLPGAELGTMLLANKTGRFVYDASKLSPGVVYYISLVVGNSNGNSGVRFNDPCLSVTPGQPFVFYEEAVADAGDDFLVCGFSGHLNANLSYGSGFWEICQAPGQALILNPADPGSEVQVSAAGNYLFCWNTAVGSCTAKDSVSVFFNELLPLQIGGDSVFCQGGAAVLEAEGTFLTFRWSTGETGRSISVDEHGRYCVTATDEAGCEVESCVDLDLILRPTPLIEGDQAVCENGGGSLRVTEEYGSYTWNNGAVGREIAIDGPGVYCVTVTGEHGCPGSRCFAVGLLSNGTTSLSDTICYGDVYENGAVRAEATGEYEFVLEGAAANGCDSVITLDLRVLDSLRLRDTIIQPDLGNNTGVISIQVAGGMPPYDIMWNTGATGNTIVGLAAGPYTVAVTDAMGCFRVFVLNVPRVTATEAFSRQISHWQLAPTPVGVGEALELSWHAAHAGEAHLQLLDAGGRRLWSERLRYASGAGQMTIPLRVPAGLYFMRWQGEGDVWSVLQVIVQ